MQHTRATIAWRMRIEDAIDPCRQAVIIVKPEARLGGHRTRVCTHRDGALTVPCNRELRVG